MECHGQAPGFFGKLPSHGDFVGRRLPPEVRQCLDDWLQRALVRSKAELGLAWLATWGSSPLWRFVIGAGVCGEQAWAGVMMPSADRVGRCFPLLLTAPVDGTPSRGACLTRHGGWFDRLEALALSALDQEFSLDAFDAALAAAGDGPCAGTTTGCVRTPAPARVMTPCAATLKQPDALTGQSAWWGAGSPAVAPCVALYPGLPAPAHFAALLDGCWAERGWIVDM